MAVEVAAGVAAQFAFWMALGFLFARPWLARLDSPSSDPNGATPAGFAVAVVAAIVGFVAFACVLMLAHIATGGAVFGGAASVPIAAVALAVWSWRTRKKLRVRIEVPRPPAAWASLAVVLVLLYVVPVILSGSSIRTGDPPWHLGWTEQLLAGEAVPAGPAPEVGRNAYPWGLHAVLTTLVRIVPGTDARTAYETMQFILVLALPLAAAAIAGRFRRDAELPAAAAAALVGGFGWMRARGAAFVTSPGDARYGADMVVASPNSVYELFPPALPRELGLVVLAVFAIVALRALEKRTAASAAAAGILAGTCGLVSVPLFVSALTWTAALAFTSRRAWQLSLAAAASATVVFATWAGPVAVLYARYGGFVDITPRLGMEWPLPIALASWGVLAPLAAAGIAHVAGWWAGHAGTPAVRRGLAAIAVACAALLAVAIVRGAASWGLAGNATLLHQGRVWPPAHLVASALAGLAVAVMWTQLRARSQRLLLGVGLALLALPSTVLAAGGIARVLHAGGAGFVYSSPDWDAGSFAVRAAAGLSPRHVVQVRDSSELAFALFQLSGVRLATYDDPRLRANDLRIRYADLAARWDARAARGGFPPTHAVVPVDGDLPGAPEVVGEFGGRTWALVELREP